jgi:ceramide glucosyltransferase
MQTHELLVGSFGLALCVVSAWSTLAVVALLRARGRRVSGPAGDEPVTVLKPLAGVDASLEQNLRSFFAQTYANYEIVFGVQHPNDPALAIARKLKAEHPEQACRIVVHDGQGINPKVANLRAMLSAGSHDLLVISDSNVAVSVDWLHGLVAALEEDGVGLAFSPIAGVGERTLGAALENCQLCGPIAAGMAVPTELFDHPAVVGKSMLFRRSVFEQLGGFESIASVLAEDYVMGRMFAAGGYRVRLASTPVQNVNETTTVRAFIARQKRWAMMRLRLQPIAYALEPLTSPLQFALLASLLGAGSGRLLVFGLVATLLRDAVLFVVLRGRRGLVRNLLLIPARDVLMLWAWAIAPCFRHVRWRGHRLRLSAGTRLYAEEPVSPPTLLRIES